MYISIFGSAVVLWIELKICSACSVIIANGFVMSSAWAWAWAWAWASSMVEYASTIYTIYSLAWFYSAGAGAGAGAGAAANCWIRSSNNVLTSV